MISCMIIYQDYKFQQGITIQRENSKFMRAQNSSVPMRAESHHNLTKNKLTIQATNIYNKNFQQAMQKVKGLDEQNKKLISISNNIMTTSFYKNQKMSFPTIISQIQIDMKNAFNELIASIQEYYVDIDTKIKDICIYLTAFQNQKSSSSMSHSTQNIYQNFIEPDKLTVLAKKVESLEQNLKRTQQNQRNLINVIDKLLQKYQPTQQVTLIRQDPILNSKIKNMKQINERNGQKKANTSLDKNAFYKSKDRPFNKHSIINRNEKQRSIHQDLKSIDQYGKSYVTDDLLSARSSKFSENDVGQQRCFIKKLYCKMPTLSIQKVSLKSNTAVNKHNFQFRPRDQYIQQSNKTHRQDYLMRNLKR